MGTPSCFRSGGEDPEDKKRMRVSLPAAILMVVLAALQLDLSEADLPVHCVHSQIVGKWSFHRGNGQQEKAGISCSQTPREYEHAQDRYGLGEPNFNTADKIEVHLKEPNIVEHTDANGIKHKGTWTMIYDEGFEVTVADHNYFAFSYFKQGSSEHHKKSVCHMTFPGWYHNAKNPDGKSWGCYYAAKVNQLEGTVQEHLIETDEGALDKEYIPEHDLVAHINARKTTWTAKVYPEFSGRKMEELHAMGGGIAFHKPHYRVPTHEELLQTSGGGDTDVYDISKLPRHLDWRNHKGQNYVSPVVNQGNCGSCYAVAVTDMMQSRIRIKTKNIDQTPLSSQHVLSCSPYSQGCKGGFPLLVGKYAQDYGMAPLSEQHYEGHRDTKCKKTSTEARTSEYHYVGGYYGACNYKKMMHELHDNGPLVVGFNTDAGIWHYDQGVYEEESAMGFLQESSGTQSEEVPWGGPWKSKRMHNRWEKTTHAVLVVGYGEDPHDGRYWIVKNSWGPHWGENGFFRIRRGVDTCAIESMAVAAVPVVGGQDYFEKQAEKLGEVVEESRFEPGSKGSEAGSPEEGTEKKSKSRETTKKSAVGEAHGDSDGVTTLEDPIQKKTPADATQKKTILDSATTFETSHLRDVKTKQHAQLHTHKNPPQKLKAVKRKGIKPTMGLGRLPGSSSHRPPREDLNHLEKDGWKLKELNKAKEPEKKRNVAEHGDDYSEFFKREFGKPADVNGFMSRLNGLKNK